MGCFAPDRVAFHHNRRVPRPPSQPFWELCSHAYPHAGHPRSTGCKCSIATIPTARWKPRCKQDTSSSSCIEPRATALPTMLQNQQNQLPDAGKLRPALRVCMFRFPLSDLDLHNFLMDTLANPHKISHDLQCVMKRAGQTQVQHFKDCFNRQQHRKQCHVSVNLKLRYLELLTLKLGHLGGKTCISKILYF